MTFYSGFDPSYTAPPPGTVVTQEQLAAYVPYFPGVVADGVTDNHATILNWITANLPNGGETPPLPRGQIATSALALPAGVVLVGSGDSNTTLYGTTLIPAGPAQAYVVSCANANSGLRKLNVDGLANGAANQSTDAVVVDALRCQANKVGIYGGSTASLSGTANSLQFMASDLFIHTYVDATHGPVNPISTVGNDWQVSHAVVNGPGQCILNGPGSQWADIHFVSNVVNATNGTAALVKDGGSQRFTNIYLDGTGGTALIDRTGATKRSIWTNVKVLQSVAAITGIPIVKETANAGGGVMIFGLTDDGAPGGASSFTNMIDAPVGTTVAHGVTLGSGWLTGSFLGSAAPNQTGLNFSDNNVGGTLEPMYQRAATAVRTAGSVTLGSATYADVDGTGAFDVAIPAFAGDVIEVNLSGIITSAASTNNVNFDGHISASGNYISGATSGGNGVPAWWTADGFGTRSVGGSAFYTVASGDISGGLVTIRLQYKMNAATPTRSFLADGTAGTVARFSVRNHSR